MSRVSTQKTKTKRSRASRLLTLLSLPLLVAAVPLGPSNHAVDVGSGLSVVRAEVGYYDDAGTFVPSSRIDASKHPNFGWRLEFDGLRRQVSFREVFVLPASAPQWQVEADTVVAPDLASAVTRGRADVGRGRPLTHGWISTPTDPMGPHTFRVWVDEVYVRELNFVLY